MPIDPRWAALYPDDWKDISLRIRAQANQQCQWCGAPNGSTVQRHDKDVVIVLTVAHLNHDPRDCSDDNLRALCQRCHITYDKSPAQAARRRALRAELLDGQRSLF